MQNVKYCQKCNIIIIKHNFSFADIWLKVVKVFALSEKKNALKKVKKGIRMALITVLKLLFGEVNCSFSKTPSDSVSCLVKNHKV